MTALSAQGLQTAYKPAVSKLSARKPAVPGPVWGLYPQRRDAEFPLPLRHRPLQDARATARAAAGRAAKSGIPTGQVRWALASQGISDASCVLALACAAQHYTDSMGLSPHPNQFEAAAHLLNQDLVELATGEGKTMAGALAAAVFALAGSPVHLLTANEYLAERDAGLHQPFFGSLGLSCAHATDAMPTEQRRRAWKNPVCYATAKTCAFDYLRDEANAGHQGQHEPSQALLQGLCVAIVDEADYLLIDEAGIPLVLSEPIDDSIVHIDPARALALASQLTETEDFTCQPTQRVCTLKPHAMAKLEQLDGDLASQWLHEDYRQEVIRTALVALHILHRDIQYLVRNDEIALIDESSGRIAEGRVLPGLLHAMVCAKERLANPTETRARSGLSYPRFFGRYHHLCGLSGTLHEVRSECRKAYGLQVSRVKQHKPPRLSHAGYRLFEKQDDLFAAAIQRARQLARNGRPVLIGTDNVAQARLLASQFEQAGIYVNLLDASCAHTEAEQIGRAGISGKITVSTQIAGRGTDISIDKPSTNSGGLHVLNLQSNRSARTDRQMAGRAARHGQPGSAEQWCLLSPGDLNAPTRKQALRWQQSGTLAKRLLCVRPPLFAKAIIRLRQQFWEFQDRSQRTKRHRADTSNARDMHFSKLSRH